MTWLFTILYSRRAGHDVIYLIIFHHIYTEIIFVRVSCFLHISFSTIKHIIILFISAVCRSYSPHISLFLYNIWTPPGRMWSIFIHLTLYWIGFFGSLGLFESWSALFNCSACSTDVNTVEHGLSDNTGKPTVFLGPFQCQIICVALYYYYYW